MILLRISLAESLILLSFKDDADDEDDINGGSKQKISKNLKLMEMSGKVLCTH